jgi:hypothetical protein
MSNEYLWNVGKLLPDYTALQPIRQPSSYSPPWEPQILLGAAGIHSDERASKGAICIFLAFVVTGQYSNGNGKRGRVLDYSVMNHTKNIIITSISPSTQLYCLTDDLFLPLHVSVSSDHLHSGGTTAQSIYNLLPDDTHDNNSNLQIIPTKSNVQYLELSINHGNTINIHRIGTALLKRFTSTETINFFKRNCGITK